MEHKDKYYNISHTQLSVARMFGECSINGKTYIYNPIDDSLTLESLMKKKDKMAIEKRKYEKIKSLMNQKKLDL